MNKKCPNCGACPGCGAQPPYVVRPYPYPYPYPYSVPFTHLYTQRLSYSGAGGYSNVSYTHNAIVSH